MNRPYYVVAMNLRFKEMMRFIPILAVFALLIVIPVSAQDAYVRPASVELPPELDRVLRDYEKAWKAGEG